MTMVCMCDGGSGGYMWGLWDNRVLLPKTPLRYVHYNLPITFSEYFSIHHMNACRYPYVGF